MPPPAGFLPGQASPPPSIPEQKKFLRYADAVEGGPAHIVANPSPEGLEVLKALYPSSAAEIKTKILAALMDTKHPVDYQTRLRLSKLMDAPADGTLDPGFVARMQAAAQTATAAHAQQTAQAAPKPKNVRVANQKAGERMQTATQSAQSGD
jgi:hypothetical protein